MVTNLVESLRPPVVLPRIRLREGRNCRISLPTRSATSPERKTSPPGGQTEWRGSKYQTLPPISHRTPSHLQELPWPSSVELSNSHTTSLLKVCIHDILWSLTHLLCVSGCSSVGGSCFFTIFSGTENGRKFPADFRSLIVEIFQFAGVMRPHPLAPPMSRPQLPKVYDVRPKVLMNHEYS